MKLIWIAVDPKIPNYDRLVEDLTEVVKKHEGRVSNTDCFPGLDDGFRSGTRFCLNDIARVWKVFMAQMEVIGPSSKSK